MTSSSDPRDVPVARAFNARHNLLQADVRAGPRSSPDQGHRAGLICPVGLKVVYAVPGFPTR